MNDENLLLTRRNLDVLEHHLLVHFRSVNGLKIRFLLIDKCQLLWLHNLHSKTTMYKEDAYQNKARTVKGKSTKHLLS